MLNIEYYVIRCRVRKAAEIHEDYGRLFREWLLSMSFGRLYFRFGGGYDIHVACHRRFSSIFPELYSFSNVEVTNS